MKGLIISDIFTLKKQLVISGLVALVYIVLGICTNNSTMNIFLILFAAMMPVSAFTYNEQCHWDTFANTLPVRRSDFVGAKFALSLGFMVFATVISTVCVGISNSIQGTHFTEGMTFSLMAGCVGLVYATLFTVLIFKFGPERSRMIMMVSFLIPFGLVLFVEKTGAMPKLSEIKLDFNIILAASAVAALAIFALGYVIALKIYRKKEL